MSDTIVEQHLIAVDNKYFHYQPTHVSPHYTHLRMRWLHYVVPDTTTFSGAKQAFIKIYGCSDRGYYKGSNGTFKTFTYCVPLHRAQNIVHHPSMESWIKLHRDFNMQNMRIEVFIQDDPDSLRPLADELLRDNSMKLLMEFKCGGG